MEDFDHDDDRVAIVGDDSGDTTEPGWDSEEQEQEEHLEEEFSCDDSGSECAREMDHRSAGVDKGPLFDLGEALAQSHQKSPDLGFGGPADFLPNDPDLYVDGFGSVPLPISDPVQADALSQVCQQAPYGKGRDTLVDIEVRNSWQLSPDQFTIKHPEWQGGLDSALPMLAKRFGIPDVPITLEPYKLLLYKPGGHFNKHRDTEKADGMFATLVVQLPSAHKGGRLHIYRGDTDTTTVHEFGQDDDTASLKCHYVAHYADAEHSLEEVESGYRLALVYSICRPANSQSSIAPSPSPSLEALQQALVDMHSDPEPCFHYILSHAYTFKSISELGVAALKGEDRVRTANLRSAYDANPIKEQYTFALARAIWHTSWSGTRSTWFSFDETPPVIAELFSLDGKRMVKPSRAVKVAATLREQDTLNPDRKSQVDLWWGHRTKSHTGYTDNEGPFRETTYHKYVLVAIPKSSFIETLVEMNGSYAAYQVLSTSDPDVGQLVDFIDRVVECRDERNRTHGGWLDAENLIRDSAHLRRALFQTARDQYFPALLLDAYLRLFNNTDFLIGKDGEGWADLVSLAKNARIWPMIEDRVSQMFDPHHALIFFGRCLDAGFEIDQYPQVYACLAEILHRPKSAPIEDKDFTIRQMHQRVMQVILSGFDSKLLDHLVAQYLTLDPSELDTPFSVIVEYNSLIKDNGDTIRQTLRPLLRKRAEWSRAYQHKVEHAEPEGDWRFLEVKVTFDWWDKIITAFLHGPERAYKIEYYGSKRAQRFCSRNAEKAEKAFITWQVFGRGNKTYIQITKTTGYFAWQQERCKELAEELKVLEELIGDGAGDEQVKGALDGEVLVEKEVAEKLVEKGDN